MYLHAVIYNILILQYLQIHDNYVMIASTMSGAVCALIMYLHATLVHMFAWSNAVNQFYELIVMKSHYNTSFMNISQENLADSTIHMSYLRLHSAHRSNRFRESTRKGCRLWEKVTHLKLGKWRYQKYTRTARLHNQQVVTNNHQQTLKTLQQSCNTHSVHWLLQFYRITKRSIA